MPSETREVLRGEVMQWDFQMDSWVLIVLKSGIRCDDRRLKAGITAEKLFQRGMPQKDIPPHHC